MAQIGQTIRKKLDNVRAALLVAVCAGIKTRCRQFYGLFGKCHGECELVVRTGMVSGAQEPRQGAKKCADFSIFPGELNDCRIVSALWSALSLLCSFVQKLPG